MKQEKRRAPTDDEAGLIAAFALVIADLIAETTISQRRVIEAVKEAIKMSQCRVIGGARDHR